MKPTISVIVITYNQEATIGRTLDSILMQQCHVPFEIVIGEDCSTDQTRCICESYANKYPDIVRLMANQQNKGILDNYFDCILASKGQYIADCAGDDFWTDSLKLEKEVIILEQHPDVTLVHTNWASYNEKTGINIPNQLIPFPDSITPGHQILEAIITQREAPVIHLCTSLYRASVIRQALEDKPFLFRNKEFGCEDIQVAFTMAQCGNIAFIPDITLSYSEGKESVSCSTNHHKQFLFTKRTTDLSHMLSEHYDIHTPKTEWFFSQRIYELGMHAFRAHDKGLYEETLKTEIRWKAKRKTMTTCLFTIMQYSWLWALGLAVRKVFVTLKQQSR